MDLIVDANIIFASLIKDSLTAELLFVDRFHLHAPEFLLEELDKYRAFLLDKTRRNDEDFEEFLRIIKRRLTLVPKEEIAPFLDKAKHISPDPGDIPYFALALKMGCALWSNDTNLKNQSIVAVFSTKDILEMLA